MTCRPDEDIQAVQGRMVDEQKSRIVCTDDAGCLVGVISLSDIAKHEAPDLVARTMREVTKREAA